MRRFLILLLAAVCLMPMMASAGSLFHNTDALAQRDDLGLLHQMPTLNPTDLAPRHACRLPYYFTASDALTSDPAYVGALQTTLRRLGYYCGPIDGIFSEPVSVAIARMQKNYSQRVTGTLTLAVRRALYLP